MRMDIHYGKAEVSTYRTWPRPLEGVRTIPESAFGGRPNVMLAASIDVQVLGEAFAAAYTAGDNSNVVATENVLRACEAHAIPKLVFTSTPSVVHGGHDVRGVDERAPYADHYGKQDSPTCGHRYEKMSTDQPDGAYQVTATSHWVVEWTGGGQSGTIEFDLTTDALPIRIGEAQVLTQ